MLKYFFAYTNTLIPAVIEHPDIQEHIKKVLRSDLEDWTLLGTNCSQPVHLTLPDDYDMSTYTATLAAVELDELPPSNYINAGLIGFLTNAEHWEDVIAQFSDSLAVRHIPIPYSLWQECVNDLPATQISEYYMQISEETYNQNEDSIRKSCERMNSIVPVRASIH